MTQPVLADHAAAKEDQDWLALNQELLHLLQV